MRKLLILLTAVFVEVGRAPPSRWIRARILLSRNASSGGSAARPKQIPTISLQVEKNRDLAVVLNARL